MKARALRQALAKPISQADFAEMVGVSEARVSQVFNEEGFQAGETAADWLLSYCARLREQAAGRMTGGQASLMQERAALARSQREAQELKNAVDRGEYAPIGLLADVLGAASSAVVDRFDQLDGALRKACPDLPEAARTALQSVLASARNEWIRSTASLIERQLAGDDDESDGDETVPEPA